VPQATPAAITVEQLLSARHIRSGRWLIVRTTGQSSCQKIWAEVVIGDFLDSMRLRTVLKGVRGAYFLPIPSAPDSAGDAYFSRQRRRLASIASVNMSQKIRSRRTRRATAHRPLAQGAEQRFSRLDRARAQIAHNSSHLLPHYFPGRRFSFQQLGVRSGAGTITALCGCSTSAAMDQGRAAPRAVLRGKHAPESPPRTRPA